VGAGDALLQPGTDSCRRRVAMPGTLIASPRRWHPAWLDPFWPRSPALTAWNAYS
jgi:hypothetical protein